MGEIIKITRQFSQRAVIESIIQGSPISRASIARQTGLSKQTVSEIMRVLEDGGFVRKVGRTSGHIGRSAINYELVPEAAYIISVDLGGTKIRVGISDLSGHICAEKFELTVTAGGKQVIEQIASLCDQAIKLKSIERRRIRLAVVGVPGAPDNVSGGVKLAPNIANFDKVNVAQSLEQALDLPVILENDVNLAVLGESWLGEGQDIDNLAYISLGTGIGSGLIVNGKLVHGAANGAGELGFLPFGADPFEKDSLHSGAFERVVASVAMKQSYQKLTGEEIAVPVIFERVRAGDMYAKRVLDETAKYLACGIGAIAAIANPQKIILGGSIGSRTELVERVHYFLPLCFPYPVEVAVSSLGHWAALIGGTALGLEFLHNSLFGVEVAEQQMGLPPANMITFKEAV